MKTLVVGATGLVGSTVIQGLMGQGVAVRCMSHTPEKITNLPKGLEGYAADLDKSETLRGAFEGVDNVFLLLPVSTNETERGLAAVSAARDSTVKKIVYLSVCMPPGSEVIPHFGSKKPIEDAVRNSGLAYTILRPNNFFQNDLLVRVVIMGYGIYPTPIGSVGLNRVDVRDVADAAVNALVHSGHEGRVYDLHGPDTLTGRETARIYSKYVGRDVRYAGDDLDNWVQHVKNLMPEWLFRDLRVMYKYFQDHGMIAPEADLEKQQLVVGHKPRAFDAFAQQAAAEWKSALACAA